MYRRAVVNFCGELSLERFPVVMIRSSEVVLRTSYSYLSVTDLALVYCNLVAKDRKPLGSIAVGRVVDKGVAVEGISEGSRAVAFLLSSPYYTYSLGGIQDLVVVDRGYVRVAELKNYSDLELTVIATLSIDRELLDYLKGRDVALIGEDLSILTFAYYASKHSCRIGLVPQYTLKLNIVKGEHVSLYNTSRPFDTIVLTTPEPAVACLATKNLLKNKGSTVIAYPYTWGFLGSICIKNDLVIKSIALGDIEVGIRVFEEYKNAVMSKLKVYDLESLPKHPTEPLFVRLS